MERYKVNMVNGNFHLDSFPDAVWLASTSALLPRQSGELADMALHQSDLRFASDCLTQIQAPSASQVVREALWQCAIVNYCKCFDEHSNARSTALKSRKVLEPGLLREALKWVDKRLNSLCDEIATELEKVDYDVLLAQPSPVYRAPTAEDVSKTRPPN